MRPLSLNQAIKLYQCGSACSFESVLVHDNLVKKFSAALKAFEFRYAEEASEDQSIAKVIRRLKRYRFNLLAFPVPYYHPAVNPSGFAASLGRDSILFDLIYPDLSTQIQLLIEFTRDIPKEATAPLFEELIEVCTRENEESKIGILLKNTKGFVPDQRFSDLFKRRPVEFVSFAQIQSGNCYDTLIVIGPSQWFPELIITAPRARKVIFLHHDWIVDNVHVEPAFIVNEGNANQPVFNTPPIPGEPRPSTVDTYIFPAKEILPTINWDEISKNSSGQAPDRQDDESHITQARLLLLAGGNAVFADAAPDAKSLILDFSNSNGVGKLCNNELAEGMFVLLRTGRGGDIVVTLADHLLGEKAASARKNQKDWKGKLQQRITLVGSEQLISLLKEHGAVRANEINVRNWLSNRSIRPDDPKDFDAILSVIGLGAEREIYKRSAELIERAHRRAGFRIRKMLLKEVVKASPVEIERQGFAEFELPEASGGSFTAYRIEDVSPEQYEVPSSQVGHVFEAWGE